MDLILQDLGLDSTRTKPVVHPGAKLTQADVDKRQQEPELDRKQAARYRSNVMRASFIAQDRPDIAEAVKSLAQFMSKPTAGAWQDLKHLGRYLLGQPYKALVYRQQRMPSIIKASVDSNHAGDLFTR